MPSSDKTRPYPYSVRWTQVRVAEGHWRDDRKKSTAAKEEDAGADLVPRKFKFAECASSSNIRKIMCPEGGLDDNSTEQCAAGYKNICDPATNGTCRLCRTCALGYAMSSDGMTCQECAPVGSDKRRLSVILGVLATLFVLLVFSLLVYLRIKSSTTSHTAKTKAVHSTVKRILLSHMQVVMLCMGLRVPWPGAIQALMDVFKTLSSVSQHVAQVGCFVDTEEPVGKQSRFLYASSLGAALFPLAFSVLLWVYWLVLVPLPCCGWLACGIKKHLTMSDPMPNVCRRICGGGGGTLGRERTKNKMKTHRKPTTPKDLEMSADKQPEQEQEQEQEQKLDTSDKAGNSKRPSLTRDEKMTSTRRAIVVKQILDDQRVKTRDVWFYCTVLFLCECFALRYSISLQKPLGVHLDDVCFLLLFVMSVQSFSFSVTVSIFSYVRLTFPSFFSLKKIPIQTCSTLHSASIR